MQIKALTIIILTIFLMSMIPTAAAGTETSEIDWDAHNDGFRRARSEGKPIYMDFFAACPWCASMENSTYKSSEILAKTDEFVFIRVNGVDEPDRLDEYDIVIYPTIIFLMPDGTELGRLKGYVNDTYLLEQLGKAEVLFNERYDPNQVYEPLADNDDVSGKTGSEKRESSIDMALIVTVALVAVVVFVMAILVIRMRKREKQG